VRDSLSVNFANFLFSVENGPVKHWSAGIHSGTPLTGRPSSPLGAPARPAGRAAAVGTPGRLAAALGPRRRSGDAAAASRRPSL
jgi:hypothetical protein